MEKLFLWNAKKNTDETFTVIVPGKHMLGTAYEIVQNRKTVNRAVSVLCESYSDLEEIPDHFFYLAESCDKDIAIEILNLRYEEVQNWNVLILSVYKYQKYFFEKGDLQTITMGSYGIV